MAIRPYWRRPRLGSTALTETPDKHRQQASKHEGGAAGEHNLSTATTHFRIRGGLVATAIAGDASGDTRRAQLVPCREARPVSGKRSERELDNAIASSSSSVRYRRRASRMGRTKRPGDSVSRVREESGCPGRRRRCDGSGLDEISVSGATAPGRQFSGQKPLKRIRDRAVPRYRGHNSDGGRAH